jgi:hypothetical protein
MTTAERHLVSNPSHIVAAVLVLACMCASSVAAAPSPQHSAAAQQAEQRAAQQLAEDQAVRAASQAAAAEQRQSIVVNVGRNAGEMARAVVTALQGTVNATSIGHSVVVTGEREVLKRALVLLEELKANSEAADRERIAQEEELRAMREKELAKERQSVSEPIFDVTLGPTLEASLNSISNVLTDSGAQGLNVVFTNSSDAALPVRAVQLKRVSLASAIRTLQSMQQDAIRGPLVQIDVGPVSSAMERPVVTVEPGPDTGAKSEDTTYHTAVFRLDPVHASADEEDRARDTQRQKATLESIEVGLEVVGRTPDFKLKLHPETGMLFVRGTRAQLRVIAEILDVPNPVFVPAPPAAPQPPTAAR